jgi:hypothetical protein
MDPIFLWIEQSPLSVWVREAPTLLAFPTILIFHTIGMALLVGTNIAIDFRILGFAPFVPLSLMEKFFPVMKLGFWLNAVSGILLLIAYPTKALTNPVFYLKLACIVLGLVHTRWIRDGVLRNPGIDLGASPRTARFWAVTSLALWAAAVTTGRLLAYTYSRLDVDTNF